ncbi:hypothetical protein [Tenacibaculum aquimarinum]|uniref:hypothetical protein n=1 Tax=Tenacibaculum aquimarinum TaxID=2910675 RepID=UPI001F0A3E97|nr:hypothetical protein [Tenacibaculum aquimarinum]MCH3884578.1 hypothetical protein [Tenacibaculum aquimarinum]
MKKLLSLAMVLATGALFAQNTNNSYQNGYFNDVTVTQMGINNSSNVNQDGTFYGAGNGGDDNMATINQTGLLNSSDVSQQGNRNIGTVDQLGWGNDATQDVGVGNAEDNIASADQTGGLNTSMQRQRFDNNNASVTQIGTGFLGYGNNYARQNQSSGADGVAGSTATIYQMGTDNRSVQRQRGSNNDATAVQSGANNWSRERQTSVAGGLYASTSLVIQSSAIDGHRADVTQNSTGAANSSIVLQGDLLGFGGNSAIVNQDAIGSGNASLVVQFGRNTATINQTGM